MQREKKCSNSILNQKEQDCCGCSVCMVVCPVKAIHMLEDEMGFLYPDIDVDKCINCGKCVRVCALK